MICRSAVLAVLACFFAFTAPASTDLVTNRWSSCNTIQSAVETCVDSGTFNNIAVLRVTLP